jgi:hypothetical protein
MAPNEFGPWPFLQSPIPNQIAYAYNPDVYSHSDGKGGRIFKALYQPDLAISQAMHPDQRKEYWANDPQILVASQHVHNVMKRLR